MNAIKGLGIGALVILGIIIADFLANPVGTKTAFTGVQGIVTPTEAALLGKTPTGYQ